jgi:DNA-binding LytR/AlgR family response regulator
MNKKLNQLVKSLSEKLGLFLSISFGVFLFVLFFQPFPLNRFDSNNTLLFVAGLGAIVFIFMVLVRITFPWLIRNNNNQQGNFEPVLPSYISGFFILALSSVAFAFYLHYVGFVSFSFYSTFKVVLICLAAPVALGLYDTINDLKQQNELLIFEKKIIQKQIEKYEEDYLNKSIDFASENSNETLNLLVGDVALIKSADNYVEIIYKDDGNFKKKLIRNTLKNIELQIKQYSNFIRCHRICIVNMHFIEKLNKDYSSNWLTIKGYNEQIPVSRQYLLKLKESL